MFLDISVLHTIIMLGGLVIRPQCKSANCTNGFFQLAIKIASNKNKELACAGTYKHFSKSDLRKINRSDFVCDETYKYSSGFEFWREHKNLIAIGNLDLEDIEDQYSTWRKCTKYSLVLKKIIYVIVYRTERRASLKET